MANADFVIAMGKSIILYAYSCVMFRFLCCCCVFAAGISCTSSSSCVITSNLFMFPKSIAGYLSISKRILSAGVGIVDSTETKDEIFVLL